MKTLKILCTLLVAFLVTTACEKEVNAPPPLESSTNLLISSNKAGDRVVDPNNPCLVPFIDLFANQLIHYRTIEPSFYFGDDFYQEFTVEQENEQVEIETLGFNTYVANLETNGLISTPTKNLMTHIYSSVDVAGNVSLQNLITDLETNYDPAFLTSPDPFYCYIYHIALEIYNNYYNGDINTLQGDCQFKDFVQHVLKSVGAGVLIGGKLFDFLKIDEDEEGLFVIKIGSFILKVTGSVIGGAIGAIVGIFTFDNDSCEDCDEAEAITIRPDDDCDLTRLLHATDCGEDVAAYEWRVVQDGQTAFFTTSTPYLEVTQTSQAEPLLVNVACLCEDELTNNIENDVEIDLNTSNIEGLGGSRQPHY